MPVVVHGIDLKMPVFIGLQADSTRKMNAMLISAAQLL